MRPRGLTVCYFLRHAESAPTAELPEPEWPLTPRGRLQAQELAASLGSRFGYEQWRAMPRPALYRVEGRDGVFALDEDFEWDTGGRPA